MHMTGHTVAVDENIVSLLFAETCVRIEKKVGTMSRILRR